MYIVNEDGSENHDLPTIGLEEIDAGQTVVGIIPGGGGYGDPLERDTDAVLHDVKEGYVSREGARDDYGVVVEETEGGLTVDTEATAELRAEMAETEEVAA
jgi:N-methylhydantoinase B/oxoprolinase/acetone carboxylase alpha subunit